MRPKTPGRMLKSSHGTVEIFLGEGWASPHRLIEYFCMTGLGRAGRTCGYLEFLGQASMATMILWPARVAACRVSMRILGMRRSAGVNKCLVA